MRLVAVEVSSAMLPEIRGNLGNLIHREASPSFPKLPGSGVEVDVATIRASLASVIAVSQEGGSFVAGHDPSYCRTRARAGPLKSLGIFDVGHRKLRYRV